ncbi:unnamed protein product [Clonostachys solani]|uniref:Uncharacterized protein n=1 Tax=Clonostachys solani TaxID=160281 RepID=A0A9N9WBB2_9HYPO|nr:unnamed protein product [Clonostachys solani]
MPPTSTGGVFSALQADSVPLEVPEFTSCQLDQLAPMLAEYGLGPMKDHLREQWLAMNKDEAKPLVEAMIRSMMEHANSPANYFKKAYKAQVDNLLSNNCHHVTDWTWTALENAREEIMQVAYIQDHYGLPAMTSWETVGIVFWLLCSRMVTEGDEAVENMVERYHLLDKIPTAIMAFQVNKSCRSGVFIIQDCPSDVSGPLSITPFTCIEELREIDCLPRVEFSTKPNGGLELMTVDSRVKRQDQVEPIRPPPFFIDVEEEQVWHRDIVLTKHKDLFDQLAIRKETDSGLAEQVKALEEGEIAVLPLDVKAEISFFAQRFGLADIIAILNEANDAKITHTTMVTVERIKPDIWSGNSLRKAAAILGTMASTDENSDVGKMMAKMSQITHEAARLVKRDIDDLHAMTERRF